MHLSKSSEPTTATIVFVIWQVLSFQKQNFSLKNAKERLQFVLAKSSKVCYGDEPPTTLKRSTSLAHNIKTSTYGRENVFPIEKNMKHCFSRTNSQNATKTGRLQICLSFENSKIKDRNRQRAQKMVDNGQLRKQSYKNTFPK